MPNPSNSLVTGLARAAAYALVAGLAFAQAALAQTEPDFHLDLDAGGHRGTVKDVVWTPDGEHLVSASDDKTIRIWDWRTGVTLRTLRGQIGEGAEGKVFAVAVSPDGKTVAAGGYFGPGLGDKPPYGDVRLFDFATGKIMAVLRAHEYAVYDLAFSPDGAFLAAGGQDGFVYLWRRDEAAQGGWTPDRKLDADSWNIRQVAFAVGGKHLVAGTADNGVRLWSLDTGAEIDMPEAEPLRDVAVSAVAVDSAGGRFATASADGLVQVWSAVDGVLVASLPPQPFTPGALSFAGDTLVVSCGYRCGAKHRSAVWRLDGTQPALAYREVDGAAFASAVSPDGTLVAVAGGLRHALYVWDARSGQTRKVLQGEGEPVTAVGIDEKALAIAWGSANPCPDRIACPDVLGPLQTRLVLPTPDRFFEPPQPVAAGGGEFRRWDHQLDGWALRARPGGSLGLENGILDVSQAGALVQSIENDEATGFLHGAFTLGRSGTRLITGAGDGTLLDYASATAKLEGEFRDGHTGEIHAMALGEQSELLVTGSADQTLRLWSAKTRELIVSLFFAGEEWVIWMPQGYYYASDEGDKRIGWHVNQGQDKEARFVRAAQLKQYLWSPELVRRAILLRSASRAVAEMRPGVDGELNRLLQRKPPEFDARVAVDQVGVREGFVAVEITGATEAGASVSDFTVLSNNRKVGDYAARAIAGDGDRVVLEVPVEGGENTIRITGANEFGYLTERSVVALGKKTQAVRKGKLFAVVIGVESYPFLPADCNGRSCDLRFPVDDAAVFLNVLAQKSAPLFSSMEALVLVNREALDETPEVARAVDRTAGDEPVLEPEADAIADNVEDFLDRPGPDDTTIVFVAGHGVNVDEDYYFIPSDGRKSEGGEWKRSSLVDWSDIQKAVERADGVRFMLLDTCHAANAFNPRLEKDAADARIVVFSATAANNTAAELPELGHGVFTYSVLQGLRGGANTAGDGVRLLGLADYIDREVVRLTSSSQKPFYYISNMENILLAQP